MKVAIIHNSSRELLKSRKELFQELINAQHKVLAISPLDESHEKFKEYNLSWVQWKANSHSLNPIKEIRAIINLFQILKKEKPDLILNYTIKPVLYGSLTSHLAGIKNTYSVITGLGYIFQSKTLKQKLLFFFANLLYKKILPLNNKVFFQNPDDLSLFTSQKYITPKKTVLINGSGVDTSFFSAQKPLNKNTSFLMVSRMIKEKGIFEFIASAQILKEKHPHTEFHLLGPVDNNPSAISIDRIRKLERKGGFKYIGESNDVRAHIENTSVFVLPSYYYEGIPRSILEALSMGKPVVTTLWRGCKETVIENHNGFLVPPENPEKLAEAMEKFILNPELIPTMGLASRKLAEEKFDVKKVNQTILETIQALPQKNHHKPDSVPHSE